MTIYNINYGIGWASSGVEYAQLYRAKMLREQNEKLKFIFLDFFSQDNIQTLTSNLGFYDEEIIWLYQYFTDIKIAPTSYTFDAFMSTLDMEVTKQTKDKNIVKLFNETKQIYVVCYLNEANNQYIERVEFVSRGKLIRKDYYSYTKVFSEYYAPYENKAKLYMRQFYNEDGSIAYNEYFNNSGELYIFKEKILYSKQEFVAYFIESLKLSEKDVLIVDRSKGLAQPIIQNKGAAKLGIVIHAEHYSKNSTSNENILWNNHYEYVFENSNEIDFYITATDRQKNVLTKQFENYYKVSPKIYTIPVGSINELKIPNDRMAHSIITASRLATEKHIDWLIKAVSIAKKSIPDLKFDIYGEGGQKKLLENLIQSEKASNYISLLGHLDLNEIYSKYELFLSGSTSEGFGLTLMEAVGSGLGMIGFEVDYGNNTFIENERNGILIPLDLNKQSEEKIINNLAESIIDYFSNNQEKYHKYSYEIAEKFKTENVKQEWVKLLKEVQYD
ncbi:accessory Sec system glycosyltransferase GtfA [Mammaliicoccus sciuri]|uniref:accessory Sec system glycosyltransferase GtfA n=1 Tax=Mammaliicoccus sciuri TaxID=1296 RepID=UPI002DBBA6B9|nr:accessory Sec system glycosyltransferase GtfA [Mammaliicoccus sciuri]MEB7784255.1 accessory Sec system glycosyltransferase GtfA [Mammaliicoccus sciuri]